MRNKRSYLMGIAILVLFFMNCSKNNDTETENETVIDTIPPIVTVISPELNSTYLTNINTPPPHPSPDDVNLIAQGEDETQIATMKFIITNTRGNLSETIIDHPIINGKQMSLDFVYTSPISGTYSVVFEATDESGNVGRSEPITFIYVD